MQETGASLIGRTLRLKFATNASCLAKEQCNPEIDNSEKIIYSLRTLFFKGTQDLFKLRSGRKALYVGILAILGSKIKVPSM
jgi:hypothetical protein